MMLIKISLYLYLLTYKYTTMPGAMGNKKTYSTGKKKTKKSKKSKKK
mgnify:CR=1 FL=1